MGTGHLCCGVFSLTLGVELICFFHLAACIVTICSVSSVESGSLANVPMSPTMQVVLGEWATLGIPLIVGAGVGAVYRVEKLIRAYFWYLLVTVMAEVLLVVVMCHNGLSCQSLEVHSHGSESSYVEPASTLSGVPMMVCGVASGVGEILGVVMLIFSAYCLYIVWTVKEILRRHYDYPGLLRYYSPWLEAAECSRLRQLPPPVVGSHPKSFQSVPTQVLLPATTPPASPRISMAAPMTSQILSPVVQPSARMPSWAATPLNSNNINSSAAQVLSPRSQTSIPALPAMPYWASTGMLPPNFLRAASPVPSSLRATSPSLQHLSNSPARARSASVMGNPITSSSVVRSGSPLDGASSLHSNFIAIPSGSARVQSARGRSSSPSLVL